MGDRKSNTRHEQAWADALVEPGGDAAAHEIAPERAGEGVRTLRRAGFLARIRAGRLPASLLQSLASPSVTVTPSGRQVAARNIAPSDAAPLVFAALLPLGPAYPLPYIETTA